MASQTEPISTYDVPNYVGEVLYLGATLGKSPLLSMAGLTDGYETSQWNEYPMGNVLSGNAAAQNVVTEDASIAAIARTSYAAAQATNFLEIHDVSYVQSYARAALQGGISGVAINGAKAAVIGSLETQRTAHLKQLACDLEFSALRGTVQAWTNAATAGATRGLVTAIEAGSETAAAGASLSKTLIDTEIARMAAAGAEFTRMVIACNAHQMQMLNTLYGFAPQSITVAGVQLQQIWLPIAGQCGVVYDSVLATDDLVFVDMEHFRPVFGIVPGKPPIFVEPLGKIAAGEQEQLYCLFGIDYSNIIFHGMVSGLATS